MPNWTTNVIKFNENQDLTKLKEFIKSNGYSIDFNKFIKEPEEFKYTSFPINFKFISPCILMYLLNDINDDKKLLIYLGIDSRIKRDKIIEKILHKFNKSISSLLIKNDKESPHIRILSAVDRNKIQNSFERIKEILLNDNLNDENISICDYLKNSIKSYILDYSKEHGWKKLFFGGVSENQNGFLYEKEPDKNVYDNVYKNSKEIDIPVIIEIGKFYYELINNYHCLNWYDWRIMNWGTKWNSCHDGWYDDNTLVFDTAWSAPIPIFNKLKEKFPSLNFTINSIFEFEDNYIAEMVSTSFKDKLIVIDTDNYYSKEQMSKKYEEIVKIIDKMYERFSK